MGQNAATVDINLVANRDVVAEHSHVLETGPLADSAVPADNGALDPRVVLDLGARQQHTALEPDTVANHDIRADGDVRSYSAVLSNLGRGVDQDVAAMDVREAGGAKFRGALLGKRGQVEAGASQEVLGLANVHPETFEIERV